MANSPEARTPLPASSKVLLKSFSNVMAFLFITVILAGCVCSPLWPPGLDLSGLSIWWSYFLKLKESTAFLSLSSAASRIASLGSVIAFIYESRSNSWSKPILAAIPFFTGLDTIDKPFPLNGDSPLDLMLLFFDYQLFSISVLSLNFEDTSLFDMDGLIPYDYDDFFFIFLSSITSSSINSCNLLFFIILLRFNQ